jgi:CheY-like chemotaxis protein
MNIIAVTAYSLEEDLQKFREAGVDECLTKPIDFDKLRQAIVRFCTAGQESRGTIRAGEATLTVT